MKKNKNYFKLLAYVIFSFFAITCSKEEEVNNPIITIDNSQLELAFSQAEEIGNLKSLIVYYDGKILKESYKVGGDPNVSQDVRSVTKSVMGILIGIAIDKGFIKSIDQPIGDYLSTLVENIPAEKAAIKIRHLLTMSSGFVWDELNSNTGYNDWITALNQVEFLLAKPLVNQPGEYFTYNSAALHLLSVILTEATGIKTELFAREYLFQPLGIESRTWEVDHQGYTNGGAGLKLTPHEMIKIGELILNRGVYAGQRIVSSEWIDETISYKISTHDSVPYGSGYGYCWWTGENPKGNYSFANGYGGQFIVVIPRLKLIVVATNEWSGISDTLAKDQWYQTLSLILNDILEAFVI